MGWTKFFRRRFWDAERAGELESYIEIETDENIAHGMSPEDARRAAVRKLGNTTQVREQIYDANSVRLLESFLQDLHYTLRQLKRAPAFALFAVLTLGIGIGVNTAMFGAARALVSWTLPANKPEELRQVHKSMPLPTGGSAITMSIPFDAYRAMQGRTTDFSDLSCVNYKPVVLQADASIAAPATARVVSGEYFRMLGVSPFIGRAIEPDDDRADAASVVMISDGYWKRHFGRDPGVLGRKLKINGTSSTIIGVLSNGFQSFPGPPDFAKDVTIPLAQFDRIRRDGSLRSDECGVLGRLRAGANEQHAAYEIDSAAREAAASSGSADDKSVLTLRTVVSPGFQIFIPRSRAMAAQSMDFWLPMFLFILAISAVLVLACANLAGLLLARGAARRHEIACRIVVGAGRIRILRQLLLESIILSILGGILGVGVAWMAQRLYLSVAAPIELNLIWNLPVFTFTAAISIITGIAFGLFPSLTATKVSLDAVLKQSSPGVRGRFKVGRVLIAAQVTFSMALLVGAGCFLQSVRALGAGPLGYDPAKLFVVRVDPHQAGYAKDRSRLYVDQAVERFRALPGVESVSASGLWGSGSAAGCVFSPGRTNSQTVLAEIGPHFFETWGIRTVAGDAKAADRQVVVNETLARTFFPDGNALGKTVSLRRCSSERDLATIIGIVADAEPDRYAGGPRPRDFAPRIFAPFRPERWPLTFALRVHSDPGSLTSTVLRTLIEVDPNVPVYSARTQVEEIGRHYREELIFPSVLLFCGAVAMILASIGIFGTLSYSVNSRTSEIGVRMTLGARPAQIIRLIVRESLSPVIAGMVAGCALGIAAVQLLRSAVFGITTDLPAVVGIAGVCIVTVATFAALIPSFRASRCNPVAALRHD